MNDLDMVDNTNNRFHRHPLAYLVEAADDICYTIIDFEDGIYKKNIIEEYSLRSIYDYNKLVNLFNNTDTCLVSFFLQKFIYLQSVNSTFDKIATPL